MLDGVVIDDTELFNDKLQEWEDSNNFDRPHWGLNRKAPANDYAKDQGPRANGLRQWTTQLARGSPYRG
jgi:hypothetical protein